MPLNFAIIGVAGFVAPRHLKAVRDTGHRVVAATDPHDSVGVLDQYFIGARFFPEIERFDRHLEKLRRGPAADRVHVVSVCSPNYLHDAHIRLGLRLGATVICEKPLVINPWNLDQIQALEAETGSRVYTVLQLRLHPEVVALKRRLDGLERGRRHQVDLTYITGRGPWYKVAWKGSAERSGGLASNIGIHFFDLLVWLFGEAVACRVHLNDAERMAGALTLDRADVRWFLSVAPDDLPFAAEPGRRLTHRSMTIDGADVDLDDGFADLHTRVYGETLAGRGFGIADARPSVELAHRIRTVPVSPVDADSHPRLLGRRFEARTKEGS